MADGTVTRITTIALNASVSPPDALTDRLGNIVTYQSVAVRVPFR